MNEEEVVGGVLGQDPDPNNIFAHDMMDHDDRDAHDDRDNVPPDDHHELVVSK